MAAGPPTSVVVEVNLSGASWTALSSRVRSWKITQQSQDGAPTGGRLDLVLENNDGALVPDNPTSSFYPNWVEGKAIRVTITKGATVADEFYGWITAVDPDFPDDPLQSMCSVTALDPIGIAARTKAKAAPFHAVSRLRSALAGFYPLTDRSARRGFGDLFGVMPDLTVRSSTSGKVQAAGDDSFSEDSDPCLAITAGRSIWHERGAFELDTAGVIIFHVRPTAGSTGTILQVINSQNDLFVLYDSGTEQICFSGTEDVVTAPTKVDAAPDAWHTVAIRFQSPALMTADAQVDGTLTTSVWSSPSGRISRLEVGADASFSIRNLLVEPNGNGAFSALVDAYNDPYGLVATTLADQTTQWGYILNTAPAWSSSVSGVAAAGLLVGGRTAWESLAALANSQSGIAYCSYTSTMATINLIANPEHRPASVSMTIDVQDDALGGPVMARDLSSKLAEVRVKSQSGETLARDPAAAAAFDATTADVETALADDTARRAIAQDRLAQSQSVKQRIAEIVVPLHSAKNDLYSAALGLAPGQRVRVTNLPSTYFGVTYLEGYVAGWELAGIADREVELTLWLLPADAPLEGRWDTDRWAFGDGVCTVTGGTAVGTTATGTMTLTWGSGDLLSTSAGDYPMDFDWNGERVTVTSAPAGGTSPRTLTITARGVAPTVARSHAANEPIDVWNPFRWAK